MISSYLEHLENEGYSPATLAATRMWLEFLESSFEPSGRRLTDLGEAELTDYRQGLAWKVGPKGKLYADNSVNQAVDVVRRFFAWAALSGLVDKNPAAHLVTRRATSKPRRDLTPTEGRKLMAQTDPNTFKGCRDRAILGLLLEAHIPMPALARLDLDHFQPDTGALWLSGRKTGVLSLSEAVTDDLIRYLRRERTGVAMKGESALFISAKGRRMTGGAFRAIIKSHAQRAKVPIPHSFS